MADHATRRSARARLPIPAAAGPAPGRWAAPEEAPNALMRRFRQDQPGQREAKGCWRACARAPTWRPAAWHTSGWLAGQQCGARARYLEPLWRPSSRSGLVRGAESALGCAPAHLAPHQRVRPGGRPQLGGCGGRRSGPPPPRRLNFRAQIARAQRQSIGHPAAPRRPARLIQCSSAPVDTRPPPARPLVSAPARDPLAIQWTRRPRFGRLSPAIRGRPVSRGRPAGPWPQVDRRRGPEWRNGARPTSAWRPAGAIRARAPPPGSTGCAGARVVSPGSGPGKPAAHATSEGRPDVICHSRPGRLLLARWLASFCCATAAAGKSRQPLLVVKASKGARASVSPARQWRSGAVTPTSSNANCTHPRSAPPSWRQDRAAAHAGAFWPAKKELGDRPPRPAQLPTGHNASEGWGAASAS